MALKDIPFNVFLLSPDKRRLAGMLPVLSADIYSTNGSFHPQGLYSTEIFGNIGSTARQRRASFIDIRTEVMHPKVYLELSRLKGLYGGILSGSMYAVWDENLKDFVKSNILDGRTGYSFFMEHFHDIVYSRNESSIRELRIQFLDKYHSNCMYRYIVVIPAGLRDIEINEEGRPVEDDINPLYRKLIRAANTISVYSDDPNNPLLDTVRVNLQKAFNEIYAYIESILEGKKGFLLSKWAARNIHNGTRNVITAMDPAPAVLGSPEAIDVNDSACGLHQYLKGTADLSIYNIKTGPLMLLIQNLPNTISVVDRQSWQQIQIEPSAKVKEEWGTEAGLEKLINSFAKLDARHKPIYIDGHYAALLYRDHQYFKVFYDIRDLPAHLSREKVSPITWTELFYISVYQQSKKVAGYVTRYPITELGSIYPSFIYLKTTVQSEILRNLDNDWKPVEPEDVAISMPIKGVPFFESQSVHVTRVQGLGADFDGDSKPYLKAA